MSRLTLILGLISLALLAVSALVGTAPVSLSDSLAALAGQGEAATQTILWEIRLPRAAAPVAVGAALGLAGAAGCGAGCAGGAFGWGGRWLTGAGQIRRLSPSAAGIYIGQIIASPSML